MKPKNITIFLLLLFSTFLLTACAGDAYTPSGWPGLTVSEDIAYLANGQSVYAVNLENQSEIWRFPPERNNNVTFYAPPVLTEDGQLLVGGYNNILYSLNAETGNINWTFEDADDRYIDSPLVTEAGIFAPNANGTLYALDPQGNLLWTFEADGPLWAQPMTDEACECVYFPSMSHTLFAISADNGALLWDADLSAASVGTPAVSDGILYLGTFGREMLAVNAENGSIEWRTPLQGWVWTGPVLSEGSLYFGDLEGYFYAINAETGEILWQDQPDGPIAGTPLAADGMVYYVTEVGTLFAVQPDGTLAWDEAVGGKLYSSPERTEDTLVIAPSNIDQLLIGLNNNGSQVWSFTPVND